MAVSTSTSSTIATVPMLRSFSLAQAQSKPYQCRFHFQLPNTQTLNSHSLIFRVSKHRFGVVFSPQAAISGNAQAGALDPELRSVLELATDTELYELERILFGPSYFSPLLKSIPKRSHADKFMIGEDLQERDDFIEALESRFLFLAADARSTLRGWRPTYRNVLLSVREKLNIRCSRKLSTEDLEAEIFLHLLQEYSSHETETSPKTHSNQNSLEFGLDQWKVQAIAAIKVGATEINEIFVKGGGVLTLVSMYRLLARKLTGKVFLETANYQIKKEILKKGGQLAAANLESRVAFLAAKQGVAGAAARYLGFRSMMSLVGPMLWGTFLADIVIQMLGTDYARLLRAIYAIAQIRIIRTYR